MKRKLGERKKNWLDKEEKGMGRKRKGGRGRHSPNDNLSLYH